MVQLKTLFSTLTLSRGALWLILIIIVNIIAVTLWLLIIRAFLCFPPIRHLAQSIFRAISGND